MNSPGFYFCLCPDAFLLRDKCESLAQDFVLAHGDKNLVKSLDKSVFWADEGLDSAFWQCLTQPGLMPGGKILLLRNAHSLPAESWKKLSQALAHPGDSLPILCLEGAWEKGQPKLPAHISKLKCLAFAEQKGWLWKQAPLDVGSMRRHVSQRAKILGLAMQGQAMDMLCQLLPLDGFAIESALEQLALGATGQELSLEQVLTLAAHNPGVVLFDFIRQLQNKQHAQVWKTLVQEGEELLFPLLALLAREVRILWQLQAGESVSLPPSVLGSKRQLASQLGFPVLTQLLRLTLNAELAVKSGQYSPAQALDFLVASASLLFSPSPAARRQGA